MTSPQLSLAERLLAELAAHPDGLSLPRLCKRLDVRMSLLMRTLAWLGEDSIGDMQGAGLVELEKTDRGEVARLTERGRAEAGA